MLGMRILFIPVTTLDGSTTLDDLCTPTKVQEKQLDEVDGLSILTRLRGFTKPAVKDFSKI